MSSRTKFAQNTSNVFVFNTRLRLLTVLLLLGNIPVVLADSVEFNTDVLDVKERTQIDISRFSQAGYIMPGDYRLAVQINKSELPEEDITFLAPENDPEGSAACLSPDLVSRLGLKENKINDLNWWNNGKCLDLASLPGASVRADLGAGTLYVGVPQAYLDYIADNWDPPSRWDDGVPGMIFDYYVNASNTRPVSGAQSQSVSGNGVAGINVGPWRLRADWQAQYDRTEGDQKSTRKQMDWSRYYAFRAIKSLKSELTLGESYLSSSMFDSFRYTGVGLQSDDRQIPPNLRGYAPEVTGVAKTNAKVTISQQGRVIYETNVAAGPFRIQDLSNTVTGKLDVVVKEEDGSLHTFQVDTASIPYLSRPGTVRFNLATGKPSNFTHQVQGPEFITGELSWGVSNGWSLYGGGLFAGDYNAIALGVGRDLLTLGAVSVDITQSQAKLPGEDVLRGGSYRLSYSKRFDEYDSQITFAGYRFSERNFMNMSQYLNARDEGASNAGNGKELYTITMNKQFRGLNTSAYLSYSHQTYWDRAASDSLNLSLSSYFDIGRFKNVSASLSAYQTLYDGVKDKGAYLSFSLPWGEHGTLGYSGSVSGGQSSHSVDYYDRVNDNDSYRISGGATSEGRATANGYYTHQGDITDLNLNASYEESRYSSVGMSLQGGITATPYGAALHRNSSNGGTRMMVDTAGVSNVPVRGNSGITRTNIFGKAVISDVNSYYRSNVSVDLDTLPEDVDATRSVIQDTLTSGAIGYRKFGILAGQKAMVFITLEKGKMPPFGAVITNTANEQTGIVSDDGNAWLAGVVPGAVMEVSWDGVGQCRLTLPDPLPPLNNALLLPCTAKI